MGSKAREQDSTGAGRSGRTGLSEAQSARCTSSNLDEDRPTLHPPSAPVALEFDHIGVIVSDLAAGRVFLRGALGISCWTAPIDDPGIRVSVQFGSAPGSPLVYELVAPLGEGSPVANALRQGKGILNHVAYRTPSLAQAAGQLRALNCFPAGEAQPAVAYGGALIQFWVSPLRFLIELIEKPEHGHAFEDASPAHTPLISPASPISQAPPISR
jgi:methylmalonyl-CoA/ethylmalonyl-CoA epimerase